MNPPVMNCFKITKKSIQKSELQYVFHLMYSWIEVITQLKLKESAIQTRIEQACFPDDETETADIDDIAEKISKEYEIAPLFAIFTKESRANIKRYA